MSKHECAATYALDAMAAHIEAMVRLMLDEGQITPHASRMFGLVIDSHKLEPIEETSSENK